MRQVNGLIGAHIDLKLRLAKTIVVNRYANAVNRQQRVFLHLNNVMIHTKAIKYVHDVLGKKCRDERGLDS